MCWSRRPLVLDGTRRRGALLETDAELHLLRHRKLDPADRPPGLFEGTLLMDYRDCIKSLHDWLRRS
jgi:hypothetical protein